MAIFFSKNRQVPMELIHKKIFTTSKIGLYQSFFLKFLILYGHRVKTEKVRHIIFNAPVITMEPVTANQRESGPNEDEKLLHVMHVTFSNFFLGICFIVFTTTKKQPNATATCVILQMNLPQNNNEGFFNFEQVLLR